MDESTHKRNAWLLIGLITAWKAYIAASIQLHPDEAYYWMWSRHLDLGYFDHAPLVAYVIRLTTIFSQQELWVRFSGVIVTLLASPLAWKLGRQLFHDEKIAAASVLTLNSLPLLFGGMIIITPDVPAFFFTALTLYWCWQLVETQEVRYWYLLGIAFGLALLSKYTSVLIAPSLVLFFLFTDERRWLRTVHPYAAFALGCAFFLPVVYWNSRHNWISFTYQLRHGLGQVNTTAENLLEYAGGQMLVASPLLFLPGIYASVLYLFRRSKQTLFLVLTSLPVVLFFGYSSIQRAAQANWTIHAYFTFSILTAYYLFSGKPWKRRLWTAGIALAIFLSFAATLHARFNVIPLAKISQAAAIADATNFFYGWKELAEELEKDPSIKFAMTERNQVTAEISYYTRERIFTCIDPERTRNNQYNFWAFPDALRDKSGVALTLTKDPAPPLDRYFNSLGSTSTFTSYRDGVPIRGYNIYHGTGFKLKTIPY